MSPFDASLPRSTRRRRPSWLSAIWLVPLLAAGGVGVIVHRKASEEGPRIEIALRDAQGLEAGKSDLIYKGVTMGTVEELALSEDHKQVIAKVLLHSSAEDLARAGAKFWLVRPRVGPTGVSALGAIISGPYLAGLPGHGARRDSFEALPAPPPVEAEGRALDVVLTMDRVKSLERDTPVFYRGVKVGSVGEVGLTDDGRGVRAHVLIERPYRGLVRKGTRFWNVGGVDVKFGLLKGAEVSAKSFSTLVAGGVAFATPDPPGPQAKDGQTYPLEDQAKDEWLKWAPKLPLPERRPEP